MAIETTKKFTKEEIVEIQNLQKEIDTLTQKMGQIYYSKLKIEEQENKLKQELSSIEKKELNLADKLTKKYGKGSLDTKTGEFTPLK
tara:strand:- start:100 stop:360 length:261 start_codon:yes stop_codon:yes gene_type:complete